VNRSAREAPMSDSLPAPVSCAPSVQQSVIARIRIAPTNSFRRTTEFARRSARRVLAMPEAYGAFMINMK
jgi:hypothetical protein